MPSTTNPEESRNELPTNPPEAQSGVCISDQIRVLTLQAEIAREEREKAKWAYELKKLEVEQDRSHLPRVSTKSSASVKKSDAINFETQPMMHAVGCLVRSDLYDKDRRMLVPPQYQTSLDAAFLRKVYAEVTKEAADEDVSNALEAIAATLYNPRKPSSLFDVWRKTFPHLDPSLILPDHERPPESPTDCHHEQFKHEDPVQLLWQDVNCDGTLTGPARVVAVGRVLCAAKGAIKCKCEPPGVKIKVTRVREESEEARNPVTTFMLGEEADDIEAGPRALTPFIPQNGPNGEIQYLILGSARTTDLQAGQHWQWPVKLVCRDLDHEVEEAERDRREAQRRERADEKKKKHEKNARIKQAIAAQYTPEAKRKRLEEQQAGTVTTGREELQKRSNGRRGTRK